MKPAVRKGLVVALLLLVFPGTSLGVLYELTDTSSDVPGTFYSLNVNPIADSSYNAVLTALTVYNPGWYIDWFQIKFDGGTAAIITDVNSAPGGASSWSIMPSAGIDLAGFGAAKFPTSTWSGLYESSATQGAPKGDLDDGPQLISGVNYVWDFNFTLSAPLNPTPSFQVGYYDPPADGNIQTTRLSQNFQVSEPGTLLLLGSGLLGLTMLRRKFRG